MEVAGEAVLTAEAAEEAAWEFEEEFTVAAPATVAARGAGDAGAAEAAAEAAGIGLEVRI